jgi:hypothetical protein
MFLIPPSLLTDLKPPMPVDEIVNILEKHKKKGRIINNPLNPSTKRLLQISNVRLGLC